MGWIGVDLDGTLAQTIPLERWNGVDIGAPIPEMVARVKEWLAAGIEVRIVTARVARRWGGWGDQYDVLENEDAIQEWCVEHLGQSLNVTCEKDFHMIELWDDRAVQVIRNTGMRADGRL